MTNKRPLGDHAEVEHHPDGDEEQAEQDRAERVDVGLELVPVGRIGEHHSGDEGAERGREVERLHHRRAGEDDEQAGDDEQFALADPADEAEQRVDQEAAGEDQAGDGGERVEAELPARRSRRDRRALATGRR